MRGRRWWLGRRRKNLGCQIFNLENFGNENVEFMSNLEGERWLLVVAMVEVVGGQSIVVVERASPEMRVQYRHISGREKRR